MLCVYMCVCVVVKKYVRLTTCGDYQRRGRAWFKCYDKITSKVVNTRTHTHTKRIIGFSYFDINLTTVQTYTRRGDLVVLGVSKTNFICYRFDIFKIRRVY